MGHQKFILTMLQTNLCGTTFPLSKQSLLYKLNVVAEELRNENSCRNQYSKSKYKKHCMNDTKRAVLTCAKNALAGWNVFGLFVRCVQG